MSRRTAYLLALPGVLWLVLFFVLPLVQLASVSLQSDYPGYPGYYYRDVNIGNYGHALTGFGAQIGRSFLYAALATVACLVLAFPLAWTMVFRAGRWRGLLMVLAVAPFFTSFILRTVAWRQILADDAPLASTLRALHLLPGGHLTETAGAVVLGLTYTFLPFMLLPVYASLERVDPALVAAGADLYATPWQTFRAVTVPLAMPGVLAGTLLTFIPAAGDYVNADLLGSDRGTSMVGNAIDAQFFRVIGGYPTAAALSFTLMVAILLLATAYVRRYGTDELVR
ncbi:ABC transporter permease [Arsenicicoccus sp. oral taxon 190]|uniref:ABC transporter permease n=1 Tax=Arsenicicoccus sp. oral taxon 190 TaxID=1658671 RepID=UPI00067A1EDD|nr:ABC transporter permease [Arsenicicoccus sp. oral taxon 190]AKT52224.1 ABC transporter permease [Arsenicicoccus sp. oral taxon 190]